MTTLAHRHAVYGSCLASAVPFPELPPSDDAPRWTFTPLAALAPMHDPVLLGEEPLYDAVAARLHRHAAGHRITVDDVGAFDLAADGRTITAQLRADAWPDFVRAHLTGRVLATALWFDGALPLHGSAVATREGVVAFLAPKGYGKSTLALALGRAGAPLVTDDTLPVRPGTPPQAWPGTSGLRVHDDALSALGIATTAGATREGKRVLTADASPLPVVAGALPLAALYLLAPVEADAPPPAREPLAPTIGAIAVVAHTKVGRMLGPAAAPAMLARTAAVVARVPVHRLYVPRALPRVDAVVRAVLDWHGGIP